MGTWLKRTAEHALVTTGKELSSGQLLESFGFTGDAAWKRLGELSGGERRRLEVLRTLLAGPNLLLLDEPTNDLDIETLTVLEDLLDEWPGSLVVVSHDRYFLERVCDDIYIMIGDSKLKHAPGGVAEYLDLRQSSRVSTKERATDVESASTKYETTPVRGSAEERALRKSLSRIERQLQRSESAQQQLHSELAEAATDPERLLELTSQLRVEEQSQADLEEEWLEISERLEG